MAAEQKGFDELIRKLGNLKNIGSGLENAMGDIGAMIRDEARNNLLANKTNKSGDLRKAMDFEVENQGGKLVVIVYNPLEHALYVEFGTGPKGQANHAGIAPSVQPRYRVDGWWVHVSDFPDYADYKFTPITIEGEQFIFTTGQPAKPFLYPAIRDNTELAQEYLKEAINELIKEAMK